MSDEALRRDLRRVMIWAEREWPGNLERRLDEVLAVFREHTAWDDENACPWNCGLPHEHTEGRGADPYYYREPIDNPYRKTEEEK